LSIGWKRLFPREGMVRELLQFKLLQPRMDLRRVAGDVCKEFGCSEEQVLEKGCKRNATREAAICLAEELGGSTCMDVAIYFGGVIGVLFTMTSN